MDFRQIQYFVALYEEESITKAARRLHVVQPAVSMQIRRLEGDFGLTLFDRTSHGVYPNAVARRLYPMCIDVLERVETARSVLRGASGRLAGALAVGVAPSIAHGVLCRVLVEFQEQSPEVQLKVHEGYSANLVDWLVQGEIDFAILSVVEGERRLRYQPLSSEELVVVTSKETAVSGTEIRGADLSELKLIVPSSKNLTRILIETEFERAQLSLAPAMEVDSLATVFGMIHHPGWATILPSSAFTMDARTEQLRCLRLVEPVIRRGLVVAFHPQKEASPAAQLLISRIEAALRSAETPRAATA